ncbi:MAG: PEPxxWA-CTERM sorting domain-containing protein [Sphingomonadaceae bacterium]|uniref:PEPxxWA-CTERM sorting domain-containing protein n=1 Tax=Thermaurantiacus sp. TaxID=2820283 RepID=UPI00298EF060|nr:PEPxxWA-CTERM sorting domain-containing protein [Thermaurantiacus sp.]MCS6986405.1 PEPxxWA-CTERM sorting domain-containing protein [Sphingomonadaceae bacterium]MDW8414334.1 PEPxxWA-CTERM sorting domain-containing protein [Thermaurantiacus sp.]
MIVRALAVLAVPAMVAAPALATGSGDVTLNFTSISGPLARGPAGTAFEPDEWFSNSVINGVPTTVDDIWGSVQVTDNPAGLHHHLGTRPLSGSSVDFYLVNFGFPLTSFSNRIAFASNGFQDVVPGQDFVIGTITYQNGAWHGGGIPNSRNVPNDFTFILQTFSSAFEFSQTAYGIIRHTTNIFNGAFDDPADYDAEADWITVFETDASFTPIRELGSLRVYDSGLAPPGSEFTNVGSIDLVARFGSLRLVGLANPRGGFFTAGSDPLPGGGISPPPPPPPPPPIPEPATWAILVAGFALVGSALRRRRLAPAA